MNLTQENFEEKIAQSETCVVDFWAPWCGPCKAISPILESVSEAAGEGKVFKVNVDENPDLTTKFGIRGIPTLIFFKKGEETNRLVGVSKKEIILENLN
jgi:thioredoxin 1